MGGVGHETILPDPELREGVHHWEIIVAIAKLIEQRSHNVKSRDDEFASVGVWLASFS